MGSCCGKKSADGAVFNVAFQTTIQSPLLGDASSRLSKVMKLPFPIIVLLVTTVHLCFEGL